MIRFILSAVYLHRLFDMNPRKLPSNSTTDFLSSNGFVDEQSEWLDSQINGFPMATPSGFYVITPTGQRYYLDLIKQTITWWISITAILISLIALAVSICSRFKK